MQGPGRPPAGHPALGTMAATDAEPVRPLSMMLRGRARPSLSRIDGLLIVPLEGRRTAAIRFQITDVPAIVQIAEVRLVKERPDAAEGAACTPLPEIHTILAAAGDPKRRIAATLVAETRFDRLRPGHEGLGGPAEIFARSSFENCRNGAYQSK